MGRGQILRVMEAEVDEAFKAIGVPDDKASAAAQALSNQKPEMQWAVGLSPAGILSLVAKAFLPCGQWHPGMSHWPARSRQAAGPPTRPRG